MCGIVGYIGKQKASAIILEGLKRLEYRGYDSAGITIQQGERFELDADGLLAVCIQHELDHLEGKVFVEYLSLLKQNRIKSKLAKKARITAC